MLRRLQAAASFVASSHGEEEERREQRKREKAQQIKEWEKKFFAARAQRRSTVSLPILRQKQQRRKSSEQKTRQAGVNGSEESSPRVNGSLPPLSSRSAPPASGRNTSPSPRKPRPPASPKRPAATGVRRTAGNSTKLKNAAAAPAQQHKNEQEQEQEPLAARPSLAQQVGFARSRSGLKSSDAHVLQMLAEVRQHYILAPDSREDATSAASPDVTQGPESVSSSAHSHSSSPTAPEDLAVKTNLGKTTPV